MLAQPKQKVKIGPNPRGNFFIEDDNNIGRKLLEKMGWKKGDGLGVSKDGISEPIKPRINVESKGLGFKEDNNPWRNHSEGFTTILNDLREAVNTNLEESSDDRKNTSKKDKVHTNNAKNLTRYSRISKPTSIKKLSYEDTAAIFGHFGMPSTLSTSSISSSIPNESQSDDVSVKIAKSEVPGTWSPGDVNYTSRSFVQIEEVSRTKKKKKKSNKLKMTSIEVDSETFQGCDQNNGEEPSSSESNQNCEVDPRPLDGDNDSISCKERSKRKLMECDSELRLDQDKDEISSKSRKKKKKDKKRTRQRSDASLEQMGVVSLNEKDAVPPMKSKTPSESPTEVEDAGLKNADEIVIKDNNEERMIMSKNEKNNASKRTKIASKFRGSNLFDIVGYGRGSISA